MIAKHIGKVIDNAKHSPDVSVLKIHFEDVKTFCHIPGQFVMLSIDGLKTDTGIPIKRAFSLPNSPSCDDHIEICVKKEGVFSSALFDLKEDEKINIEGPYGNFNLKDYQDKKLLFIAGGTGISPLISMIRYLTENKVDNEIDLLYSVKNVESIIYKKELEEYSNKFDNFNMNIFVTQEKGNDKHYNFERINKEKLAEMYPNHDRDVYICGPNEMVSSIIKDLEEIGFAKDQIHREVWG